MTTEKKRTITLTDRPPVRIVEDSWPLIASGIYDHHDGEVRCQANRTWKGAIRVRQHEDGRAIVYGRYEYDSAWRGERGIDLHAGVLLAADSDIVEAIHQIGRELVSGMAGEGYADHIAECIRECIANLPAEEI